MRFGVLGPITVEDSAERPIQLRSRIQRTLLAVLLCRPNQPFAPSTLGDAIWGEAGPARTADGLRVHLHHLRRALGGDRITRRNAGYQLNLVAGELDAWDFRRLVKDARELARRNDRRTARDTFRRALALWRGPAFADIDGSADVRAMATALDEDRADAYEDCFELELASGRHDEITGEVRALAAAHPFRERLVGQLMLALCRRHRHGEALAVFEKTRALMAEELGTDPGRLLRDLHERILREDPTLTTNPANTVGGAVVFDTKATEDTDASPGGAPAIPGPAQLPLDVFGFAGRGKELARLDGLLASASDQPTAVVVSALSGTAGVGKTALVVHWAHRVADRFKDGQLYVNLRGFDPGGSPMSPAEAVRAFLDALGVPPERTPRTPEGQVGLYRSLLAGRRILVVLDNARDAEQVRPLLPGSPGCLAIVTSRSQLSGLAAAEGAHLLALDVLSPGEAWEMLVRRLGEERVAAEVEAVSTIIARCARLPLALAVVAAQASAHPEYSLARLATELGQPQRELEVLAVKDPAIDVRAVLSWSYRTLSDEAARLFRLLGLHPGPDFGLRAAASLAGIGVDETRSLTTELKGANLITEHTPGRYAFHDLLRAYAVELVHTVDDAAARRLAMLRMLDHYLHTSFSASRLLDPHSNPIPLDAIQAGTDSEPPVNQEQARSWFVDEHAVLIGVIQAAVAAGRYGHTWRLAWTMVNFLHRQGLWNDWIVTQRAALDAGAHLHDRAVQARAHLCLGGAAASLGRYDDAERHYKQADGYFSGISDATGQAQAANNLAILHQRQGRYLDALEHARRSLLLHREGGNRAGQANALNMVGWCHAQLGEYREAITFCEQALELQQELGNSPAEAATWDSLGYIHHHLGDHVAAIDCYGRALDLFREHGDRYFEAEILMHLGDTYHASGDADSARDVWRQALDRLEELGNPLAEEVRARLVSLDEAVVG